MLMSIKCKINVKFMSKVPISSRRVASYVSAKAKLSQRERELEREREQVEID